MMIQDTVSAGKAVSDYQSGMGRLANNHKRMSTGMILPTDDPAGMGISERMRSTVSSLSMALQNTDNGISFLQSADSWMQNVGDMLSRMQSLSVQSGGLTSAADKDNINIEFKAMRDAVVNITSQSTSMAQFNGIYQLRGGNGQPSDMGGGVQPGKMSIQVGADPGQSMSMALPNLDATNNQVIGTVHSYNYNDQQQLTGSTHSPVTWSDIMTMDADSPDAVGKLAVAIDFMANSRASTASQQVRLEYARTGLMSYEDNMRSAESKIRDVDMAREVSLLAQDQMQADASMAMVSSGIQVDVSSLL